MAKYEIEIDDELAQHLSYDLVTDEHDKPELIPARLSEIVARYGRFPKLMEPKHEAALAILRDKAMERSVQVSAPGEGAWEIKRRAEEMLDAILGGSR